MLTPKTVRVLCLDGGGARGFLQIKFLQKFCKQAGIAFDKLAQYFDLICGSSVGGINALAIAANIDLNVLENFYLEKAPWIFTIRSAVDVASLSNNASSPSNRPNFLQKVGMLGISDPFYKAVSENSNYGHARLNEEAIILFGERRLEDLEIPVIITGHNYSAQSPIMFGNIDLPFFFHKNVSLVQAARATAAAPVYFPSYQMTISEDPEEPLKNIIDGGIFNNNPSLLGVSTAQCLYPSANRYCILSVGTGEGALGFHQQIETEQPSDNALVKLFNLITIEMADAAIYNDLILKQINSLATEINMFYYRFNFKLDPNINCELDNTDKEFFDYLAENVNTKYNTDMYEIGQFISRLGDSAS